MKKKLLVRCLIGAPIGLAVTTIITIIISLFVGDGRFYAVVPELVADCGSEINAVLLQSACSLLYGAAWAGASLIWEQERWSLLRQTATHFVVGSAATLPVAYFMRWMEHSVLGVAVYFGIFIAVYFVIWATLYFSIRKKLREVNSRIKSGERE